MKLRILQIVNKDCPDISKQTDIFSQWMKDNFLECEFEIIHSDINIQYRPFGVYGDKELFGVSDLKKNLEFTDKILAGFHIIQFFYSPNHEDLSNWTYPNDIKGASLCEFPIKQEFIDSNNTSEVLKHETAHALYRILNRLGVQEYETIDQGGNLLENIQRISKYKDSILKSRNITVEIIRNLIFLIDEIISKLSGNDILLKKAKELIGKNLCGEQKMYGCALTMNELHRQAFGNEIGGGASTALMQKALEVRKDFQEIKEPEKGCIIISATIGEKHGHVGIYDDDCIYSNNSPTGTLENYWLYKDWINYYSKELGLKTRYYRKLYTG